MQVAVKEENRKLKITARRTSYATHRSVKLNVWQPSKLAKVSFLNYQQQQRAARLRSGFLKSHDDDNVSLWQPQRKKWFVIFSCPLLTTTINDFLYRWPQKIRDLISIQFYRLVQIFWATKWVTKVLQPTVLRRQTVMCASIHCIPGGTLSFPACLACQSFSSNEGTKIWQLQPDRLRAVAVGGVECQNFHDSPHLRVSVCYQYLATGFRQSVFIQFVTKNVTNLVSSDISITYLVSGSEITN